MTWNNLQTALADSGYIASDDLSVAIHLSITLGRPLLLEGAAGVGKTQLASSLATQRSSRLIRLQCYEGLDAAQAIYEWNYQRQLLSIRAAAEDGETGQSVEARIFSREFLLERPLLAAITQKTPPVLLIDEIDRADEEFEAYLLEILSEFQVTIPELGTITATSKPIVILTSNGTRDLSDALRRRCPLCLCGLSKPRNRTCYFTRSLSCGRNTPRSSNRWFCAKTSRRRLGESSWYCRNS